MDVVDPFADLFDGDRGGSVELFRRSPTHFNGQEIAGYCGYLNPGDTHETVKQRFGGGLYDITRRGEGGRFVARRALRIAGPPAFVPPSVGDKSAIPQPDSVENIESDEAWERRMRRLLAERAMLSEQPPAADSSWRDLLTLLAPKLIEKLFERRDSLGEIVQVKELLDSVGSQDGGLSTDSPWVAALSKFADVILTRRPPGVAPVVASAQVPELPAPAPAVVQVPGQEAGMFEMQRQAQSAVQNIGDGFLTDPRTPAGDIVRMLEFQLGVQAHPEIRAALWPHRETFWGMVKLHVESMAEPSADAEARVQLEGDLRNYFSQVFDGLCSPGPESKVESG